MTVLTRADLTLEAARRVAWQGEGVELGARALAAMSGWNAFSHDPESTIYGVTTGLGRLARRKLTPEQREQWAGMSPARAATSWGDPLPERVVRAIVLARLTNFVEGHAAVSPGIAQGVAAMLGEGRLPAVPAKGQGGAGEILSLSHLFTDLAEKAKPALKDMLCLVNGSPAATGLVTDAALVAEKRFDVAAKVLALAFEAFNAPLGHLDGALGAYWNNPHDRWALERLRELVGGHGGSRRPYQAPVSFRIAPRMLGQARRAALRPARSVRRGPRSRRGPATRRKPVSTPRPDSARTTWRARGLVQARPRRPLSRPGAREPRADHRPTGSAAPRRARDRRAGSPWMPTQPASWYAGVWSLDCRAPSLEENSDA